MYATAPIALACVTLNSRMQNGAWVAARDGLCAREDEIRDRPFACCMVYSQSSVSAARSTRTARTKASSNVSEAPRSSSSSLRAPAFRR